MLTAGQIVSLGNAASAFSPVKGKGCHSGPRDFDEFLALKLAYISTLGHCLVSWLPLLL